GAAWRAPLSGRSFEGFERVERHRGTQPAAGRLSHSIVAPRAVTRVDPRRVGLMTRRARRAHLPVVEPDVKRVVPPALVATGIGAGLRGLGRRLLGVRVMALPAGATMRVFRRIEGSQHLLHLVTGKAFLVGGNEGPGRRIPGGEPGDF